MPEIHDLGGRTEHFAPVPHDPDEPVFHQRWEERVFGIVAVLQKSLNKTVDEFRYETEKLPAHQYLPSYFKRWLAALENQLTEDGYLAPGELDAKLNHQQAAKGRNGSRLRTAVASLAMRASTRPTMPAWVCAYVLPRVFGGARPTTRRAAFAVGDQVRVRARSGGHTRQPGYVTGKVGVVTEHLGAFVFPDARAVGRSEPAQHLYTVAFPGRELWGERAESRTELRVDLYEPYLEEA